MYGVLSQLFLIHSFSSILITLLTISLFKSFVHQYSTFYSLFFFSIATFSWSYYLLIIVRHYQNPGTYKALQVFLLFVHVTKNTADVTTLYANSLPQIFAKPVFNTLFLKSLIDLIFYFDLAWHYRSAQTIAAFSKPNIYLVNVQSSSIKKVLLKISQSLLESSHVGVSFLIKFQTDGLELYWKRDSSTDVVLCILENFQEYLIYETPANGCYCILPG